MATSKRSTAPKSPARPKLHLVDDAPEETPAAGNSAVDRAEALVDRLGEWGHKLGRSLLRAGARVKEEVEDVWAEAKSAARSQS